MAMLLSVGNVWAAEMAVDFESATSAYSDWTFTNFTTQQTNSNVTAHGGSYFGTTGGKATGSLQTKNKVNPSSITFYYSKTSTNTTASYWKVQVSTDGSDWTEVSQKSAAANVTRGTWYTYEEDLSAYSDVYVRIYYDGTTAVRCLDDVVLTTSEGGGTPTCATPTFSPAAGSYEGTQNVTITSTAGATIYYTTDGSTPSTSSSVYSSPIAVSADMTINAYAVKADYEDSEVATAAYTITEGPDVTLDFTTNSSWGLPTTNTLDEKSYTSGGYTISIAGAGSGNGFKFSTNYLILGKSGAYIILPQFSSRVEKIVVVGNSIGSESVVFNIFDGNTPVSTAVTGCKTDKTFEIEDPAVDKQYTLKVTSNHNLQLKAIKFYFGEAPAVAKPMISGEENFVGSTSVSISQADADHIYYTTNGDAPTTSSTVYSAPFSLTNTATIKAIAVKGGASSAVAEKTFTKVEALESLAALLEATTSTETAFNVVISNWVVTAVNGTRAWIADAANEKGILLYKSGHNFTVGNKLNGVVIGTKTKLYQGYPELTSLVSTEVTITSSEAITPRTTTIAALASGHNAEQGTIVKLENLTYTASSTSFSDGENTLALNTQLYNPSMVDGAVYTIIGVVRYDNNNAISIMPRSENDLEQIGGGGLPEVDGLAALKAEATGASYLVNLTNAIVTLVDGSNAFIEDATAGALIYKSGHGFSVGDKLNGQYEVTTATYQGKFEITAIAATTGTKTTDAEIPVTTLTIAQLNANFAANESKRIKIVGVNVTDAVESGDATARTGEISDGGENTITLYAGKSGVTAAENANIDVIGYPTFHNTDQQLAVWAQADITVNSSETPIPEGAENVVIIAEYDSKYYAMSTTNANNAFTAIAVEYDGSQITVNSAEDKAAIQWTKTTSDDNTTFQDASGKYMKSADGTTMSLQDAVCNWAWDATGEYYKINNTSRTFFYQNGVGFKNFAISNFNKSGYSDKAQVIAIAAENIVINSKVSAELAYDPASVELIVGDEFIPATLTYAQGFDGLASVTYESNNTNLATVNASGIVSLVANAIGTATITATFAGNDNYKAATVSYNITVNSSAPTPTSTIYRKVTATAEITDGEYLIVYEGDATHDAAVFDGSLDNVDQAMKVLAVEIENDEIAGNTDLDAATFTIDVTAGSLQSASGWYIGRTANSNGMDKSTTEAYVNTFAITEGVAVITGVGGCTLRYNYASDQLRFRYYKSGQQAIQLYKKESVEPVEPELTYENARTGLTVGKFYTICMPRNILGVRGATFWNLNNRNEDGSMVYFVEAGASLDAGKPYIFIATATTLEVAYGEENAGSPVANGALRGTFSAMTQGDFNDVSTANGDSPIYMLVNNQLRQVAGRSGNSLGANRAYVIYNELQAGEPTPAPGRRVLAMPMNENVATGIDALGSDAQPSKIIVNGQLFIIRDGKAYDATGRLVSKF